MPIERFEIDPDQWVVVPKSLLTILAEFAANGGEDYLRAAAMDVVNAAAPRPEPVQSANIDRFALDLMQEVWAIGNRHGPDTQRKAQIQTAIAEAVTKWQQPAQPIPTGWAFESFNDGRIRLLSPDGRYVDLTRGVSGNEFDPINTLYDFIAECGLTRPPTPTEAGER